MSNILILYDSKTGNTAKMAELVALGARANGDHDVKILRIDDAKAEDIRWCDGIALGSPTNMGLISWKMKKFWDDLGDELWGKIEGKIGCAFSSSGGWGGGAEITCQSALMILINFGFLVFGVTDYVDEQLTLHYGATVAGEPRSAAEKAACLRLGERLAEYLSKFKLQSDKNINEV